MAQSIAFVFVMGGVAVIAVLAFIAYLLMRQPNSRARATDDVAREGKRLLWMEYLLAIVVLLVVVVGGITLVIQTYPEAGAVQSGWRVDSRSHVFLTIMGVSVVVALLAFVIGVFVRWPKKPRIDSVSKRGIDDPASATETSAGAGILGLLCLFVALLLLNWVAVERVDQYRLILHLLYPATLGVALVLLFDKATRDWSIKQPGEALREWVFCDLMVFFLFLAFLNVVRHGDGDTYSALFWDVVNIVAFFLVFWVLDRRVTRYRFLVGYVYFTLVPLLLLIWRTVQGHEVLAESSWWESVWPFFLVGLIFALIEVMVLIGTRSSGRQGAGGVRDVLFVVIYGMLLLSVAP